MRKKKLEEWRTALLYAALYAGGGRTKEFHFYDLWSCELLAAWYGYRLT